MKETYICKNANRCGERKGGTNSQVCSHSKPHKVYACCNEFPCPDMKKKYTCKQIVTVLSMQDAKQAYLEYNGIKDNVKENRSKDINNAHNEYAKVVHPAWQKVIDMLRKTGKDIDGIIYEIMKGNNV